MTNLYSADIADRLNGLADANHAKYVSGEPYPHIVIDDFLPAELLEPVVTKFPSAEELKWQRFDDPLQKKLAFAAVEKLAPDLREFVQFFNSSVVLQFLERLTGITGLIADPYFTGGGFHQIQPGGKLGIHADFNKLERLGLDRRLNLILYLNKDWREEYGGQFEMWDAGMQKCVRAVLPNFNRCVVFSTTDTSFHGHPNPLSCPEGRSRKSMALYYYSNGRPDHEKSKAHTTLFRDRPGLDNTVAKRAKALVHAVTPPIIIDMCKSLMK